MCMICAQIRPYDEECAYEDLDLNGGSGGVSSVTIDTDDAIEALHFDLTLLTSEVLNTTEDDPYEFTFQFDDTEPGTFPGMTFTGWTAWTESEREAVRDMLDHVENFINVEFTEVTGDPDPDINFGKVTLAGSTIGFGGYRYSASGGTLSDYDGYAVYDNTRDISSGDENLILHEIGHFLANKHPFSGSATLPTDYENNKFSVMSYTDNPDNSLRSDALMLFDILALQARWGANMDYKTGNNTYKGPKTSTIEAIWDAGGTDELDAGKISTDVILDLREGYFSRFGSIDDLVIAYGTVIENATGGKGDDTINGNDEKNKISGGKGNDTIKGNGGKDTIKGGGGKDTVNGGAGADKLKGQNGNDTLKGNGGGDTLEGGKGNDKLFGNGGADEFVIASNGGTDKVKDFQDNTDTLVFDINGINSVSDALDAASKTGSDVTFSFADGTTLIVEDIAKNALSNDIEIA